MRLGRKAIPHIEAEAKPARYPSSMASNGACCSHWMGHRQSHATRYNKKIRQQVSFDALLTLQLLDRDLAAPELDEVCCMTWDDGGTMMLVSDVVRFCLALSWRTLLI